MTHMMRCRENQSSRRVYNKSAQCRPAVVRTLRYFGSPPNPNVLEPQRRSFSGIPLLPSPSRRAALPGDHLSLSKLLLRSLAPILHKLALLWAFVAILHWRCLATAEHHGLLVAEAALLSRLRERRLDCVCWRRKRHGLWQSVHRRDWLGKRRRGRRGKRRHRPCGQLRPYLCKCEFGDGVSSGVVNQRMAGR